MDKKALRRAIGEKKRALTAVEIEARSAALAEKLFATRQYRHAGAVYAYLSFNQEVRTWPIIERAWADGKRVAVPKVVGDEMVFVRLDRFDELTVSDFGVPEPAGDGPLADDGAALVLVPGLAFDPEGRRVGYGGGYYDRYLSRHPRHVTIALCYDFQLVDHIEAEAHDVPVDLVLTDAQGVGAGRSQ